MLLVCGCTKGLSRFGIVCLLLGVLLRPSILNFTASLYNSITQGRCYSDPGSNNFQWPNIQLSLAESSSNVQAANVKVFYNAHLRLSFN